MFTFTASLTSPHSVAVMVTVCTMLYERMRMADVLLPGTVSIDDASLEMVYVSAPEVLSSHSTLTVKLWRW